MRSGTRFTRLPASQSFHESLGHGRLRTDLCPRSSNRCFSGRLTSARSPAALRSSLMQPREQMLVGTSDLRKSAHCVREPLHHANQERGLSIWLGPPLLPVLKRPHVRAQVSCEKPRVDTLFPMARYAASLFSNILSNIGTLRSTQS